MPVMPAQRRLGAGGLPAPVYVYYLFWFFTTALGMCSDWPARLASIYFWLCRAICALNGWYDPWRKLAEEMEMHGLPLRSLQLSSPGSLRACVLAGLRWCSHV
ncbi:hypothetical protein B0I35DRAFT_436436 [Stachybotrys elegans]|uniref:Uncharacterized protein n=1 Tax=Stachybotrys elegans TaxID=80388 RepID=A0A8K0SJL4_9HYPO|nr:hypothetical protein B0I35DRAFT_436436 [Stachybotrys elegans]